MCTKYHISGDFFWKGDLNKVRGHGQKQSFKILVIRPRRYLQTIGDRNLSNV